MKTAVIVNGAQGKMGRLACETLSQHPDFNLVAQLTRGDHLKAAIKDTKAQIVVDLTRADCVFQNSLTILEEGAHAVIGTSGLLANEIQTLSHACESQQLGALIVPNFSISAVLMMMFAAKAAQYFTEVEIVEAHHQQKLDAPSGTALKTAEMIAQARQKEKNALTLKELIPGARGAEHQGVPIHSLRLPGVLARQEVIFGNVGETLSIIDNSIDRSAYMPGVVLACQKVINLQQLVYGLEHLL